MNIANPRQPTYHTDTQPVWTALQATYDKQTANGGQGNPHIASGILAMIFLYSLAFNIGWNPLQVTYVIEILPYHLRAKVRTQTTKVHTFMTSPVLTLKTTSQGLVLYNLFVAAALVFNQYANPIALDSIRWKCKSPLADHKLQPKPARLTAFSCMQTTSYTTYGSSSSSSPFTSSSPRPGI